VRQVPAGQSAVGEAGDAQFITGLAGRLAAASRLPWLPRRPTDRFAASGCQQAIAAIGQPGHLVLIAADGSEKRLGFLHATMDESVFTQSASATYLPSSSPPGRRHRRRAGA